MKAATQKITKTAAGIYSDVSRGTCLLRRQLLLGLFLLSVLSPAAALDPNLEFDQYVIRTQALKHDEDGLPTDIAQDKTGFLWIGKTNGLVRYDGRHREYYQTSDDDGLISNAIERLYIDSRGQLTILTDTGISKFVDNEFSVLARYSNRGMHMNSVIETTPGNLVFGGESGLFRLAGDELHPVLPFPAGVAINSLQWFDEALWIGGSGRLWSLRDGTLSEIRLPTALAQQSIFALAIYRSQLWMGTSAGLWKLNDNKVQAVQGISSTSKIRVLQADRHGAFWFGGPDLFGRLLPDDGMELIDFKDNEAGYRAEIRSLLEDKDGNFWIARDTGEVLGIRDSSVFRMATGEGLPLANVNTITTNSNGTVLIGHDLGVSSADSRGSAKLLLDSRLYDRSSGAKSILASAKGDLWLGSDQGVAVFSSDGNEKTPKQVLDDIDGSVSILLEQKPGLIWIGTNTGLFQWENKRLTSAPELHGQSINVLHAGADGRLWVGTDNGLFFRRGKEFVQEQHLAIPDHARITSIASLPDDLTIASVRDKGILVGRGGEWRLLDESNNFPKESTFFLGVAPDGYIWGVTSTGIYRVSTNALADLDRKSHPVRMMLSARSRFRPELGIECCNGMSSSAATMHKNMLYVSSTAGVLFVDTSISRQEMAVPVPYLRGRSQRVSGGWRPANNDIELETDERYLRIRYSALQLINGANVRYRYRLGGEDSGWVNSEKLYTAVFAEVGPGSQVFEVQASVRDDEWSNSADVVRVIRSPSFVETKYFYALAGLALIAIYALLIYARALWLRRRVAHIEGIIHQKTADLQAVNESLNKANEDLKRMSHCDALTGLHNRRYLESNRGILGLHDKLAKDDGGNTALVLLDIDLFKRINDEYGHAAGDAVLQQFAEVLKSFVRANDEVIRWGGEEFLMVLRYRTGSLPRILDRICQSVRSRDFRTNDNAALKVTVSIGAIACPTETLDNYANRLDDLFQCSDMALYSVKRNGRDGWAICSADNARFRQAAASPQLAEDMIHFIEDGTLDWQSSRSEMRLDANSSIIELALVRQQKTAD